MLLETDLAAATRHRALIEYADDCLASADRTVDANERDDLIADALAAVAQATAIREGRA